jgi:hypothetical protein
MLFRLRQSDKKLARSSEFLIPRADIPTNSREALKEARSRILDAGWRIAHRKGTTSHGRKYSMTLRKIVFLSSDWSEYPPHKQAAILWHELVHVRQRQRWGNTRFLARYASARGRWSIETPAYRMSIRIYERLSRDGFDSGAYIQRKLRTFRSDYWLKTIRMSDYTGFTRSVWSRERRG